MKHTRVSKPPQPITPARVSQALKLAVLQARCNGVRQHEIARAANLHQQVVSSLLNDVRPVYPGDERVIALGKVVGVAAADCFADDKVGRR